MWVIVGIGEQNALSLVSKQWTVFTRDEKKPIWILTTQVATVHPSFFVNILSRFVLAIEIALQAGIMDVCIVIMSQWSHGVWKSQKNVSFNNAYILSGQKFIKITKNAQFGEFLKT